MQTNNHKIVDYDEVLDAKFGKKGTPSRIDAEEKAFAFYNSQVMSTMELEVQKADLAREILTTNDENMIKNMWLFLKGKAKVVFHDNNWSMKPEELGMV